MEKVWLATKYYLDDKLSGCSAATERMFTRLLAWVGDNETGGKLPKNPHTFVGLLHGKSAVNDLVSRGVLLTQSDGGYAFAGWGNWNSQADELAQRKRADRERKRRERERKAGQSRDMSRDVTNTDEDRDKDPYLRRDDDERNTHTTESSSTFADGTPIPDEPPPTEISASTPPRQQPGSAARTVVRQELGTAGYPRKTLDRLAVQVGRLAHQGLADDVIRESLREWERRSGAKPEWLETIAGDVVQGRRARAAPARVKPVSTTDARIAAAQALKDRPQRLRGIES